MTPEMQAELLKRLDALATKLGTTAEHLWTVLVAQARIEGLVNIIWATVAVLAALALVYGGKRCWKGNDADRQIGGAILYGLAAFGLALAVASAVESLTPLLNPEYWAFKEILRLVK